MTTQGSKSTVTPLRVPAGKQTLESIIVAGASNNATLGQAHGFIRLEGDGLVDGPESIAVTGIGSAKILGQVSHMDAKQIPLNLRATPGNEVEVYGEIGGTVDPGQISIGVTLVFA